MAARCSRFSAIRVTHDPAISWSWRWSMAKWRRFATSATCRKLRGTRRSTSPLTEQRMISGERTAPSEGSSAAHPSGVAGRLTNQPHFCLLGKNPGYDDCTLVERAYGPALHVLESSKGSRRCAPIWTRSARVPHGGTLPSFRDFRRDSDDRGL